VAVKRRLGKLEAPADLLVQLKRAGVELLPINTRHAGLVGTLPMHHRGPLRPPVGRSGQRRNFSLVSGDGAMRRYGIEVIW
jgi:PIN domain nuclease of toxin-antitoxin system